MRHPNYLSALSPCAERMTDRGTCQICLQTSHLTSSTSPVRGKLDLQSEFMIKYGKREYIQNETAYSPSKTLESLCLAPVWFCLRWSGLHQQFCCHWSRSPVSCMSTGNDLLHFHLPHQRYLQKNATCAELKNQPIIRWINNSKAHYALCSTKSCFVV